MESRFLRVSGDASKNIVMVLKLSWAAWDQTTLELGRVVFLIFAVGHIRSIPLFAWENAWIVYLPMCCVSSDPTATPRLSPTWAAMARRSHGRNVHKCVWKIMGDMTASKRNFHKENIAGKMCDWPMNLRVPYFSDETKSTAMPRKGKVYQQLQTPQKFHQNCMALSDDNEYWSNNFPTLRSREMAWKWWNYS